MTDIVRDIVSYIMSVIAHSDVSHKGQINGGVIEGLHRVCFCDLMQNVRCNDSKIMTYGASSL